ncbi:MAG TPA: hypothetical protein VK206_11325 [Anaerolineales bacterium]|nr:hypothetical protein [Anaerolineales bacterium]HLO33691.1 hypothetical protein [Anaerolineales bacterium]
MKRIITLTFAALLLVGCAGNVASHPAATAATKATETVAPSEEPTWNVYDSNPAHIWNRVFHLLYSRTASDGKEYGLGELDPLVWFDTTYLLTEPSHQRALQVLNEFLATHAENLIKNPLKRAMFQRDLWAVFDWLASQTDPYPSQRRALEMRLAQIIRRVALTREQIISLPDNYALAVQSNAFPANFQADNIQAAFLPADLFQPNSPWIPMGREGGPIAMAHTEAAPFFGRSVFLVFVQSPDGRTGTLDFIHSLNENPHPTLATGSDVALVRRMLLIDDEGDLVLSPLVETVQIRHFAPEQIFHEFELDRMRLLNRSINTLNLNTALFLLFSSHGDVFQNPGLPRLQATIPDICRGCHLLAGAVVDRGNIASILSYSRASFPLPDNQKPVLLATNWESEAGNVKNWKMNNMTWKSLKSLWNQ